MALWLLVSVAPSGLHGGMLLLQVASTRKGLRNQLKTLLWRKASAEPGARPATASGNPYDHSTIEGQMRALADLAFIMQVAHDQHTADAPCTTNLSVPQCAHLFFVQHKRTAFQ